MQGGKYVLVASVMLI